LCQSLAKSAQILLVMSDRTDTFRELCNYHGMEFSRDEVRSFLPFRIVYLIRPELSEALCTLLSRNNVPFVYSNEIGVNLFTVR
jgi:hypothetical protein